MSDILFLNRRDTNTIKSFTGMFQSKNEWSFISAKDFIVFDYLLALNYVYAAFPTDLPMLSDKL